MEIVPHQQRFVNKVLLRGLEVIITVFFFAGGVVSTWRGIWAWQDYYMSFPDNPALTFWLSGVIGVAALLISFPFRWMLNSMHSFNEKFNYLSIPSLFYDIPKVRQQKVFFNGSTVVDLENEIEFNKNDVKDEVEIDEKEEEKTPQQVGSKPMGRVSLAMSRNSMEKTRDSVRKTTKKSQNPTPQQRKKTFLHSRRRESFDSQTSQTSQTSTNPQSFHKLKTASKKKLEFKHKSERLSKDFTKSLRNKLKEEGRAKLNASSLVAMNPIKSNIKKKPEKPSPETKRQHIPTQKIQKSPTSLSSPNNAGVSPSSPIDDSVFEETEQIDEKTPETMNSLRRLRHRNESRSLNLSEELRSPVSDEEIQEVEEAMAEKKESRKIQEQNEEQEVDEDDYEGYESEECENTEQKRVSFDIPKRKRKPVLKILLDVLLVMIANAFIFVCRSFVFVALKFYFVYLGFITTTCWRWLWGLWDVYTQNFYYYENLYVSIIVGALLLLPFDAMNLLAAPPVLPRTHESTDSSGKVLSFNWSGFTKGFLDHANLAIESFQAQPAKMIKRITKISKRTPKLQKEIEVEEEDDESIVERVEVDEDLREIETSSQEDEEIREEIDEKPRISDNFSNTTKQRNDDVSKKPNVSKKNESEEFENYEKEKKRRKKEMRKSRQKKKAIIKPEEEDPMDVAEVIKEIENEIQISRNFPGNES